MKYAANTLFSEGKNRTKQDQTKKKTLILKENYWKLKPKEPGQKPWGKTGRTVQIRNVRRAARKLCPEVVNPRKQNKTEQ